MSNNISSTLAVNTVDGIVGVESGNVPNVSTTLKNSQIIPNSMINSQGADVNLAYDLNDLGKANNVKANVKANNSNATNSNANVKANNSNANVKANNVKANVKANNVKANNSNANVKANNVKANNVKANNVKANNVKANNVKANAPSVNAFDTHMYTTANNANVTFKSDGNNTNIGTNNLNTNTNTSNNYFDKNSICTSTLPYFSHDDAKATLLTDIQGWTRGNAVSKASQCASGSQTSPAYNNNCCFSHQPLNGTAKPACDKLCDIRYNDAASMMDNKVCKHECTYKE